MLSCKLYQNINIERLSVALNLTMFDKYPKKLIIDHVSVETLHVSLALFMGFDNRLGFFYSFLYV